MPALKTDGSAFWARRIHSRPPPDTWDSDTARSVTHWGRSGAVVSVHGELDAANSGRLAGHVQHCAHFCEWLVLDLSALDFIGTAGFSALKTIVDRCADTDVYCTLVPGIATTRLLRICDPAGDLPTTSSVAEALGEVQTCRQVR